MRAGIAAAQALGASIPWNPISCNPRASLMDFLYMALFTRFARQAITAGHLRIILPNGAELELGAPPTADSPKPAAQRTSLSTPFQPKHGPTHYSPQQEMLSSMLLSWGQALPLCTSFVRSSLNDFFVQSSQLRAVHNIAASVGLRMCSLLPPCRVHQQSRPMVKSLVGLR